MISFFFMPIFFIVQEIIDGSLDSSNFDAINQIGNTMNPIILSIKESLDSNPDKVNNSDKDDDSITTSNGSMFAPNNDFCFTRGFFTFKK